MNLEAKEWWRSRTIWGSLAVVAASVLRAAGFDVDEAGLTEVVLDVVTWIGAGGAIYGRAIAKRPIRTR